MSFFAVLHFTLEEKSETQYKQISSNIDLPALAALYDGGISKIVKKIAEMLLATANSYETLSLAEEPEPLNQYCASKYKFRDDVFVIIHTGEVEENVLKAAFSLLKQKPIAKRLYVPKSLYEEANKDTIVKISHEMKDTLRVMHRNIDEIVARNASLDNLKEKTRVIKERSGEWKETTEELNSCWHRWFGAKKKKKKLIIYSAA